jgi:xylulokinase
VALYLGFDCSTQSMTAVVIDADARRPGDWKVVFESALTFDAALPEFGAEHGVLPHDDPRVSQAPPAMWAEALDLMMARVAASGIDLQDIAGISGGAQQHGSVYVNADAGTILKSMDPARSAGQHAKAMLSRPVSPLWMDASAGTEAEEIESAVGGPAAMARRTGSRAFARFTAAQIRRFWKHEPEAYARTTRVHLVSSFLASLLAGVHAPLDPGDASGMNLMDLEASAWWTPAVEACAPDLLARLPAIVLPSTIVGTLSPYWQRRHGFPPVPLMAWTGDNQASMAGSGIVSEGQIGISLGTSDTIFGPMREPRVDPSGTGTGHVYGAPMGAFMALTCFANGSLARERVRDMFGLDWAGFTALLRSTPPGNEGRMLLPWFEPEITPRVVTPGLVRHGLAEDDAAGHVRGIVEAQMMAMARHSAWMGVRPSEIRATGGASGNPSVLQVMADVFGARVFRSARANTTAPGAALGAFRGAASAAGVDIPWDEIASGSTHNADPIDPDPAAHAVYQDLMLRHARLEGQALAGRV